MNIRLRIRVRATLTPARELRAVELWRTLLLSLDDLLVVMREFVNPRKKPWAISRRFRR